MAFGFTKLDLERIQLHIRRNEELIARQRELIAVLRRKDPAMMAEAEQFLTKLQDMRNDLHSHLKFVEEDLGESRSSDARGEGDA